MKFTDSHCHLDFAEFEQHLTTLLTNCVEQNIHRIIVPSIAPSNWQKVLLLTKKQPDKKTLLNQAQQPINLFAALGIHPWFLNNLNDHHLNQLSTQVKQHKQQIIAIGETGIDGKIAEQEDNLAKQLHFFDFQLTLAKQEKLPIIIHHRRSHQHILPLLKQYSLTKAGIIHAFSGSYQQAKQYIDLGYKLGIGGTITYPRAKKTINAIKRSPLSSLVLETDAPAMPLSGFQGEINSPLHIIEIFNTLVNIRSESAELIAEQLELNSETVFNFA